MKITQVKELTQVSNGVAVDYAALLAEEVHQHELDNVIAQSGIQRLQMELEYEKPPALPRTGGCSYIFSGPASGKFQK